MLGLEADAAPSHPATSSLRACGCADSDNDFCCEGAISGQCCLKEIENGHFFQWLAIHPNDGIYVVSAVHDDLELFCGEFYEEECFIYYFYYAILWIWISSLLALAVSRFVRSCSSLLLRSSGQCLLKNIY